MPMKTKPKPEDIRGDSRTFVDFARKLVAVPHAEIKAQAEEDGARKLRLFGPSSRASGAVAKREP
jgi:hypothetical protein